MSSKVKVPALALVGGGIFSVQFGSALASTLFSAIGPSGAVLLRLLSASIVLLIVWRPRLPRHDRRRAALTISFGVVLAGMNLSFFAALHRIPLGAAVTFEFVGPLTVALLGSRRAVDLVWVALAAGGIVALSRGGSHALNLTGVLLALLAGGFWGCYILLSSRVGRSFSGGTGLALAMGVGTIVAAPFGLIDGGGHLLEARSLVLGCAVGMLSSAIPYSLEVEALRRIDASVFAVLMSLEPAVAALAGLIVLNQGLAARELGGILLVVIASAGASQRARAAPIEA